MSVRFQAEVAGLASQGITLADFLPDEIEDFVRAVDRCDKPFTNANAELIGMPITACEGVHFWKLTIGASVWLDQYAKKWWLDTGRQKAYFWAIVYSLIHGRERDAFLSMTEEGVAYEKIKAEALRLAVTEDEITEAVDYALDLRDEEPTAQKNERKVDQESDWQELVVRLETQSGKDADYWCWGVSLDYAKRCYLDLRRFARVYGGGTDKGGRMKDELDRALNNLARVKTRIITRIMAEREAKK